MEKVVVGIFLFAALPVTSFTTQIMPILLFQPIQESHGLVVETEKTEYAQGEQVTIRIFIVNYLTIPVTVGSTTVDLKIAGGDQTILLLGMIGDRPRVTVEPGQLLHVSGFQWQQQNSKHGQVAPGPYSITARIDNLGRWGRASLLIMPI